MEGKFGHFKSLLSSQSRLEALDKSKLLDSPVDLVYDMLTEEICFDLHVPVAAISLVDKDRQFFKSQHGFMPHIAQARQTPIQHSICQNVVYRESMLAIDDITQDEVFYDHPAQFELNTIAYLGEPLIFGGEIIGAVCAVDTKPHHWTEKEKNILKGITNNIQAELYYRYLSGKL